MPKLLAKTLKYIADNLEKNEDYEDPGAFDEASYYAEEQLPASSDTGRLINFPQRFTTNNNEQHSPYQDYHPVGLSSSVPNMSEIILMEPHHFQDALKAVSAIRMQKVVVLNLSKMQGEDAQRAIDFVSGGTYMIDGDFEKIDQAIFLFMPYCIKLKDSPRNESLEVEMQYG